MGKLELTHNAHQRSKAEKAPAIHQDIRAWILGTTWQMLSHGAEQSDSFVAARSPRTHFPEARGEEAVELSHRSGCSRARHCILALYGRHPKGQHRTESQNVGRPGAQ